MAWTRLEDDFSLCPDVVFRFHVGLFQGVTTPINSHYDHKLMFGKELRSIKTSMLEQESTQEHV